MAPSYWLEAVTGRAIPATAEVPPHADVAIVGGGLMGVATAYWLQRLGVPTLVLERDFIGGGASGRNGGIFLPAARSIEDVSLVRSVVAEEDIDARLTENGHLALAQSPTVWCDIRNEVARRPKTAPPLHALDRASCVELLGIPVEDRILGGRWLPTGSVIHPARFVHGLAHAAARRGARFALGTTVTSVQQAGNGWTVRTNRGDLDADHVVLACQAATPTFAPELTGVLVSLRNQVVATSALPPVFHVGLALDWGTRYWQQRQDGTVILGGGHDPHAPVGLSGFLRELFPSLPAYQITRSWMGTMDVTADDRPTVGSLPGPFGRWVIAGFGGHGLPAGIGAGRALADSIITGTVSSELAQFDPRRITEHELEDAR